MPVSLTPVPSEGTTQEDIFEDVIKSRGLRYEKQRQFGDFIVDFYIEELLIVIEADGIYGHTRAKDRNRDFALLKEHTDAIKAVHHIKESGKSRVEEVLGALLDARTSSPEEETEDAGNQHDAGVNGSEEVNEERRVPVSKTSKRSK